MRLAEALRQAGGRAFAHSGGRLLRPRTSLGRLARYRTAGGSGAEVLRIDPWEIAEEGRTLVEP
ncbi:MAG TPA: hypothetical protein VFI90_16620 [Rubrobacter sp.]|nr:hypothetical protein [Rubrobacter sp.]